MARASTTPELGMGLGLENSTDMIAGESPVTVTDTHEQERPESPKLVVTDYDGGADETQ